MEIRKNNLNDPDRAEERDEEQQRLEGFAASEMADRGPKDVIADRSQFADTDAAAIRPVSNVNGEEGDEDYDDEEDTDDLIGDDVVEDDDLDEEDFDEEVLEDVDLDEDEDDEDDTL